jgi:hypothetical protein
MKTRLSFLAMLALGGFLGLQSPTAVAQSPLTLVQSVSPSGSILLTITGLELPCAIVGQTSTPTIALNVITITTTTIGGDICFPEPPPPTPIYITVDLGHLPPGHYFVTWLFPAAFPPTLIEFDATAAAAPPIPTLGPTALALLLGSIALLGMFSLQRPNAR